MQKVKVHDPTHKGEAVIEDHWKVRNVIIEAGVFASRYDLIGAKRYEEVRTNQTRDITGLRLTL